MDPRRRNILLFVLALVVLIFLAAGLSGLQLKDGVKFDLANAVPPANLVYPATNAGLWPIIIQAILALISILLPVYLIYMLIDKKRRKRLLFDLIGFAVLFFLLSQIRKALSTNSAADNTPFQMPGGIPTAEAGPVGTPVALPALPSDTAITITALIIGGIIVLIVAVVWFALARRMKAQPTVMVQIAEQAEETIDLLVTGKDLRETILLCYQRMTQITAKNRNLPRDISTTPTEFEKTLVSKGLPASPVQDLTRIFEDVRYGDMGAGEDERRRAVNALRVIAAVCREPEKAP